MFVIVVGLPLLVLLYALLLYPFTPSRQHLEQMKVQQPTVLLATDGAELHRLGRSSPWIPIEEVAPVVIDALVATEDHRFYTHHGVDVRRLASSVLFTVFGDRQGGSTLTMQLARNLYPRRIGRAPTLTRKLKEIITALKIESVYEKEEILEAYLNTVPYLYNATGVEMAARTYFGTSASHLDASQAATLVGMLKATSYYNPVRHPERARQRRDVVLRQMVRYGRLDPARYAAVQERALDLRFERQSLRENRTVHFTEHVRNWLSEWAEQEGYDLQAGGLRVYTTLDLSLQQLAEAAVARQGAALQAVADVEWSQARNAVHSASPHDYPRLRRQRQPFAYFWETHPELLDGYIRTTLRYRQGVAAGQPPEAWRAALQEDAAFMDSLQAAATRLEVGFVAIDPRTGYVKAWVGSRSYATEQYDHVAQARRQPGSTFKPFVYGAALEAGYTPDDVLVDRPVELRDAHGQVWRPANADGITGEALTLREALAQSVNTVTVQLIDDVGPRRTARLARRMGITRSRLTPVPSLALGTSEVTLLEMTSAYATLANGGRYRPPVFVTRIEDAEGQVLASFEPPPREALSEASARALVDMMRGVIDEGTGQRIRSVFGIRCDVAGKTGTTQEGADGWFLLMHPHLVGGAWVGFNDPRVTFRSDYWGQGGHNALYVVGDFYRQALRQGELDPRPRLAPGPEVGPKTPSLLTQAESWVHTALAGLERRLTDADGADGGGEDAPPDARPADEPAAPPSWTRRVEVDPMPEAGEVPANLVRDLDRLLRDVEELVGEDTRAAARYRRRVVRYARRAEQYLREQSARERAQAGAGEQFLRALLEPYVRELDAQQRAEVEQVLRELERARR